MSTEQIALLKTIAGDIKAVGRMLRKIERALEKTDIHNAIRIENLRGDAEQLAAALEHVAE